MPRLDLPLADHVVERLEGDVRVDRPGAVAQQQREVVDLPRVAALDDQPARVRIPAATRWWCSPAQASSDGIGAWSGRRRGPRG
jgi:hypothetical protein